MKNIIIVLIVCLAFVSYSYINSDNYAIYHSKKANCDILLNKKTGVTWFNINGYWEKVTFGAKNDPLGIR